MSHLAIDFGTKKIGMAVSMNNIAFPLEIVATKDIFKVLPRIVSERQPENIIVGIANHMDGRISEQTIRTREFIKKLSSVIPKGTKIIEWDERLTSYEAKSSLRDFGHTDTREHIDDMAAAILLQSYLDQSKGKS